MSAYASTIEQLTAAGVPRDKAEASARARYPEEAAAANAIENAEQLRRDTILEKREQQVITNLARAIGFKVYNLSQARKAKQTTGLPDLWLSLEAIGFCAWWETKRQVGGKRKTAQVEFGEECKAARIPYGFGDRYEFARWLTSRGFTPPTIPQD